MYSRPAFVFYKLQTQRIHDLLWWTLRRLQSYGLVSNQTENPCYSRWSWWSTIADHLHFVWVFFVVIQNTEKISTGNTNLSFPQIFFYFYTCHILWYFYLLTSHIVTYFQSQFIQSRFEPRINMHKWKQIFHIRYNSNMYIKFYWNRVTLLFQRQT